MNGVLDGSKCRLAGSSR